MEKENKFEVKLVFDKIGVEIAVEEESKWYVPHSMFDIALRQYGLANFIRKENKTNNENKENKETQKTEGEKI